MFDRLFGDADGMAHRQRVAAPVRHHHKTGEPQQHSPAVMAVVHPFSHAPHGPAREQGPQEGDWTLLDLFSHHPAHQPGCGLGGFDKDVAREPVGHNDIRKTRRDLFAFDIALKTNAGGLFEQLEAVDHQLVALARLFAVAQNADRRLLDADQLARVDGAHHRKLLEMFRPHVGIGADVQDQADALQRGERADQSRPRDPLDPPHVQDTGGQGPACIPGRHKGLRCVAFHQFTADDHRAV